MIVMENADLEQAVEGAITGYDLLGRGKVVPQQVEFLFMSLWHRSLWNCWSRA